MKKLLFVVILMVLLAIPSAVGAKKDACTTIQSGELLDSMGNPLTTGYNQYGYNYQAMISNQGIEEYCQQRNDIP